MIVVLVLDWAIIHHRTRDWPVSLVLAGSAHFSRALPAPVPPIARQHYDRSSALVALQPS
jgi:hypothetical protein